MNGEALKIHIPSTTYPQFVHNSPPSFVSKAFQTALLRPFGVTNGAKNAKSEGFLRCPPKNFGAGRRRSSQGGGEERR
jgi:hypothetical protein